MTSYLSENEAENLQNVDVHLAQIPDFEMEYLETLRRINFKIHGLETEYKAVRN